MTLQSTTKSDTGSETSTDFAGLRRHQRRETNYSTVLNCRGSLQSVVIRDISLSGAKISETYGLFEGDKVTIKLPDRSRVPARIVWSLGSNCGLSFDKPLSEDQINF